MRNWLVRDVLGITVISAILIGLSYLLGWLPIPGMAYYNRVIVTIGINIILAVSLNIINGHAGQFSMGHAGFMAVGAYTSAYLTYFHFQPFLATMKEGPAQFAMQQVLFLAALLAGGGIAALAGWLVGLPSLRLRGDYLAIVTLGFGEIIRVLILNIDKIGGARGLAGVPAFANFFWVYLFVCIVVIVSWRLIRSQVGRAFLAVREDEIAAEAMGVNTTHYKVQAFVIGSFFAGIAGGLLGHYLVYLNPGMFQFTKSFEAIVMVVLGGMGSISGAVLAAVILSVALEALRFVKEAFGLTADPRMVIYAIVLILLMRLRPQGVLGNREIGSFFRRRNGRSE
ncbi:MAG: branched-chain amino acid ABC transporter permease [Acidobacteria bacterium]|nr:branched-chain amino acid ABC transporter permease [Acidobacteriota bacterium]